MKYMHVEYEEVLLSEEYWKTCINVFCFKDFLFHLVLKL